MAMPSMHGKKKIGFFDKVGNNDFSKITNLAYQLYQHNSAEQANGAN